MTYWLTKGTSDDKEYIVMKHTLPGVNYTIHGVKFRNGFAVVEKNSKVYYMLKKIPTLSKAKELPLIFLRKLPFITRPQDVLNVYGKDVYNKYIKLLEPQLEQEKVELLEKVEEHRIECGGCRYVKKSGEPCADKALPISPAGYCGNHLLEDPTLPSLGLERPRFMSKEEKKAYREKVWKVLEKHYEDKKAEK